MPITGVDQLPRIKCMSLLARRLNIIHHLRRHFSERSAGTGGVWTNDDPVIPSERARQRNNSRLRRAHYERQQRLLPPEIRDQESAQDEEDLQDLVESRIHHAMVNGEFNNLPGKGKPLKFLSEYTSSAHPEGEFGAAVRIMKQNNVKPPWLELMSDIDKEKARFRKDLRRAWKLFGSCNSDSWTLSLQVFEERVKELNSWVDHFNLTRPRALLHLFRLRLRLPQELEQVKTEFEDGAKRSAERRMDSLNGAGTRRSGFRRVNEIRDAERPTWGYNKGEYR